MMHQEEFPKIKKATHTTSDLSTENDSSVASSSIKTNTPSKVLIASVVILVIQIGLFIKTYDMHRRTTPSKETHVADKHIQKSRNLMDNLEKVSPNLSKEKAAPVPQVVADFNQNGLLTNFKTRISLSRDDESGSVLQIASDTERRFGTFGRALLVAFDFSGKLAKSASVEIALPVIDIARFRILSFRLLTSSQSNDVDATPLKIQLIPTAGEMLEFDIQSPFAFWKRYELELWQGRIAPSEFLLKQIKLVVVKDAKEPSGTWYFDDLVLE